jgi:hypothetical protein
MVVRCTKKMLNLLGAQAASLRDSPPTNHDWYLDLLWIERQKCLLLVHQGTLFSAFRIHVRSADLRPIGTYLAGIVESELRAEGLPRDTFPEIGANSVHLAKTASRSTVGFMVQMALELRYRIAYDGGLARCDTNALNHDLRRTPRKRGAYVLPIELVTAWLASRI